MNAPASNRFNPRGIVTVTVRLTGPSGSEFGRMMLDTGSSFILARPAWLRSIGYNLDAPGPTQVVITASGRERLRVVRVARVEALGLGRDYRAVLAHEIPAAAGVQGLLGLDSFRGARLTIDFGSGTIELA